jgi:hypothetical protein
MRIAKKVSCAGMVTVVVKQFLLQSLIAPLIRIAVMEAILAVHPISVHLSDFA